MGKKSKLPTLVKCSTASESERENPWQELKDVACFVFNKRKDNFSVFLVDLAQGKLQSFLHIGRFGTDDYPYAMAFAMHKSMLYMFGGYRDDVPEGGRMVGVTDAYELDLVALAKACSSGNEKPLPKRITEMNAGKKLPEAVKVGNKICVFDTILGHKPPHCSFEVYDPELKAWDTVSDPFRLKRGHFVDTYCVEDNKLFVSIREKCGIYELDFGASPSPAWHHHDLFLGASTVPVITSKLDFGTLIMSTCGAYDVADEKGFEHWMPVKESGKTADLGYEIVMTREGEVLQIGPDKVCTITIEYLRKPYRESRSPDRKKPRTLKVQGKCRMYIVVNICRVDPIARPIQLTVLQSFKFSEGFKDEGSCYLSLASICDALKLS